MNLELLLAFRHAFLAGLGVAVACSLLSPFVLYKRMAFAGEGISHAGFGGIGVAFLLGMWWPALTQGEWVDVVLAVTCVATALAIGRLAALAAIDTDAAIGVALVVAMAVGIGSLDAYSHLRPGTALPGVHGLLFGDVFSAGAGASVWAWCVAAAAAALVAAAYRELVFFTFDEEGARIFGAPVGLLRYIFLAVMALAIVAAMRLVGVILVTALLVMPGLIGRAVAGRFGRVLMVSVASGAIGMVGGLLLVITRWPYLTSGPAVVLTFTAMLAAALGWQRLRSRLLRRAA